MVFLGLMPCLIFKAAVFVFCRDPSDTVIVLEIGPHTSENANNVGICFESISINSCLPWVLKYWFIIIIFFNVPFPSCLRCKISFKQLVITFIGGRTFLEIVPLKTIFSRWSPRSARASWWDSEVWPSGQKEFIFLSSSLNFMVFGSLNIHPCLLSLFHVGYMVWHSTEEKPRRYSKWQRWGLL